MTYRVSEFLAMLLLCVISAPATAYEFSSDEQSWLNSHHDLRVGTYTNGLPPLESLKNGKLVGVGPDFLQMVTSQLPLTVHVKVFSDRSELINAAHRGDVDVIMNMAPTFTGSKFLRYSQSYADNDLAILTMRKNNQIIDQLDLQNVRISVLKSSAESLALPELYPNIRLLLVNSTEEAAELLEKNEADAFIGNKHAILRYLSLRDNQAFRIAGDAGLPLSTLRFAFPKEHILLADIFDKILSEIDENTKKTTFQRWTSDILVAPHRSEGIELSPAQLAYLTKLPTLQVSNLEGYPPFSFRNNKGEPSGLVEDYFNLVQRQLQFKSERVPAHDLNELTALIKSGRIDLVPGLPQTEERNRWLAFSKPYVRFPLVIITRQETLNVDSMLSLGKARVAISEHAEPIPSLLKENPNITLVNAVTVAEGLEMVANYTVDAYIGNLVVSDRIITEKYIGVLKVAAPTGRYAELSIAVTPKLAYLIPLINQALDNIGTARRERIRTTWFPIRYEGGINWGAVVRRVLPGLILLGSVIGVLFVAYLRLRREISQKIEAQRILGNQLRFQSALLETIPFPVIGKDRKNRYIAINSAYEEQFGANRLNMLGRTPEEVGQVDAITNLESAPSNLAALAEQRTLHQALRYENVHGKNCEGLLWLKPFMDHEGQLAGSVIVLVDVSEIRLSEARARASEALLTDVTESLPVTVFQCCLTTDGDLHFSYVAGAPGLTFGLSAEAMMRDHASFYSLLDPIDRPKVQAGFEQMASTLQPFQVEFRMHIKNSVRWLRGSTGTGSREPNGDIRWGGYFEDITETREHKQELENSKAKAEAATKIKSEFLAMMSHEIRTPVHGILGWLELLEKTALSAQQKKMLLTIQNSTNLLSQVVNDILDFSKLEAGHVKIENTHVDLRALLDETIDVICLQAKKKNINLQLYLDKDLSPAVLCDPFRVRQIILNLLSNSLKFTESGQITLRLDVLKNSEHEQKLCISVSDTGIGISEEMQSLLFRPFQQAETSTTRRFGGTGLGLSISKALAKQMGGVLTMYSVPNKGTTVSLNVSFLKTPPIAEPPAHHGVVAVILCRESLLANALQANLMALGMTVLRIFSLPQLASLKIKADFYFINKGTFPSSGSYSFGDDTRVIFLDSQMNTCETDWQKSRNLKCNPLLWGDLVSLCDFWLNGNEKDLASQNKINPLPPVSIMSREAAAANGKLVLVAEDHPVSRELIQQQIELLGFVCDTVADGKEAMDAIDKKEYGLIIADYHMPYIDGLELSRKLRQAEITQGRPRLPIVALTASVMSGQAEECIAAGMDAYLRKPLKLDELRAVLERYLSPKSNINDNIALPLPTSNNCDEIDLRYVEEVYGSSQRVRKVLLAVTENLHSELSSLEVLVDRDHQAKMIHHMASGLGIIKALPLLRLASELEMALQDSEVDVGEKLAYFKARIRLLLKYLESELAEENTDPY
ncbi:transporter substrate-binding domain-containing protein [Pseudomonas protegens]|uniref:transporter substrate-binding domain-containing protein n=1 Tax=Pseudomonas protegens TaxID=380021 RepID=UPI0021C6A7B0|nr:transporter substrate-binding domain-containing protein [Pseudomonas protegens]MCU1765526.1 transporter substrate-binding domain-containing protein [Pseudomonas protegens]